MACSAAKQLSYQSSIRPLQRFEPKRRVSRQFTNYDMIRNILLRQAVTVTNLLYWWMPNTTLFSSIRISKSRTLQAPLPGRKCLELPINLVGPIPGLLFSHLNFCRIGHVTQRLELLSALRELRPNPPAKIPKEPRVGSGMSAAKQRQSKRSARAMLE